MPSTRGSRAPACRPLASLPLSCPSDLSCAFLRVQSTPSVSYHRLLCASEIISVRGGVCFTCLLNLGTKPDSSAEAVLSARHRGVGFQVQICRDVPLNILETEASYLCERRGVASRPPPKRWVGGVARCGAADLLGVCDVKDLMGPVPLGAIPGSDFSVQPRIPEAARIYCMVRANNWQGRRLSIVENYIGIQISHIVFHRGDYRPLCLSFFGKSTNKNRMLIKVNPHRHVRKLDPIKSACDLNSHRGRTG